MRAAAGDLAVRHGDELERWLTAQHDRAIARGLLCRMRHVGPPHRRTGVGGHEIRIVGLGPADYQGQLPGGRAIALEANNAASRGRLCVTRRGGEYEITEVLSREGGALHVEAVTTWPRPNLDIGNLLPRPKDSPR